MMKVAAALLLLPKHEEFAPRAIEILQQSRMLTTRDADKTNILLGLEYSYQLLNDHVEALEIARLLVNEYPESEEAFQLEAHELLQLNKYAEAERAADDRLKRIPDDLEAMRIHLEAAMGREDYSSARDWSMKLLNNQRAISIDLNSVAWDALFTGKISPADIDQALNALQLNQDDPSTMHTLACLYSEQGNASKAAEILARSMDLLNMAEPNPDYWYAFGRIAELYGERDEAISSYKRVKVPEQPAEIPTSTYKLAQIRLRVLNSQGN
jgi:tetratricopeptide (TPR) repeat protein